ncbi:CsxC family protein, partial [Proteiniborus sp. DW1]|uniref:CsxC family protein n=1 Tax=Proteiniborus sp. DW1 TaxID=1889883 RepID=UPI000944EF86
ERMVNVKAEYPEVNKIIYENPKPIHNEEDVIHEIIMEQKKVKSEEETIVNCPNEEVEVTAITSGAIAKIPVVLATFTLRINLSSLIEFSEPIFQIKEINKKVNISQCTLVQGTSTVFIKGFIKKDISYYTGSSTKEGVVYGEVEKLTAEIPFKCTTLFSYNIMKPEEIKKSTTEEFKYAINNESISDDNDYGVEAETIEDFIYGDSSYINQVVTEYYNEAPYCEVVCSKIVETEKIIVNRERDKDIEQVQKLHAIEGEGVLYITIRILQKKLVSIPKILEKKNLT